MCTKTFCLSTIYQSITHSINKYFVKVMVLVFGWCSLHSPCVFLSHNSTSWQSINTEKAHNLNVSYYYCCHKKPPKECVLTNIKQKMFFELCCADLWVHPKCVHLLNPLPLLSRNYELKKDWSITIKPSYNSKHWHFAVGRAQEEAESVAVMICFEGGKYKFIEYSL